jgi:hypothetical protein
MTTARLLPLAITKEIRALLPAWGVCAVALAAIGTFAEPRLYGLGLLACGFGSVALGALSIGHEYTHRTIGLLLSQPIGRGRLLLLKLFVLAPMLLALTGLSAIAILSPLLEHSATGARPWGDNWPQSVVLVLPMLCGLFLTPWLTMLCRSPLAGIVFTILVPFAVMLTAQLLAAVKYGWAPTLVEPSRNFAFAVFWCGMVGICTVAAVLSWRMFRRLEANDGPDQELHLPSGWTASRTRHADQSARRHPVWLLVKKELRLQQLAFVVGALSGIGWATLSCLRYFVPEVFSPPLGAIAILYSGLQALVIGSLASAEERQFGTVEWQVLLPMAVWRQWVVKAATAIALALLLGVAGPVVLAYLDPSADIDVNLWYVATLIATFTVASLYVSSLSASGVKAVLWSIPGMVSVIALLGLLAWEVDRALYALSWDRSIAATFRDAASLTLWLLFGISAGFLALVLWFAMLNHRSSERGFARAWPQALWMCGYLIAGCSVVSIVLAFR